jgi:hypothetical protein
MAKSKHKQQAAVSRSATLKQDRKSKSNTSYLNSGVLPIAIALLVVTFIAFFPTFSNDFVNWDDGENIYDNANLVAFDWNSIQKIFTSNIMGGYNPLPIFTFAIERAFFGLNPVVFDKQNSPDAGRIGCLGYREEGRIVRCFLFWCHFVLYQIPAQRPA